MRKNKDLFSIFPADAGVNLYGMWLKTAFIDIPRGCGGEPCFKSKLKLRLKYSPRMRG